MCFFNLSHSIELLILVLESTSLAFQKYWQIFSKFEIETQKTLKDGAYKTIWDFLSYQVNPAMTHKKHLFHADWTPKLYYCLHYTSIFQFGRERFTDEPLSNRQRVKKPLKSDDFRGFWSEWGDSNSRHLAPKASALPTALHPDMKFFQLWSNMWSTPIFDQLPARGKVLSAQLSQGFPGFPRAAARTCASRSQSRRATNCATPGYKIIRTLVAYSFTN